LNSSNDTTVVGLHINDKDNVATIFDDTREGNEVKVIKKNGNESLIEALNHIPYGHKIALNNIKKGEIIIKYGEEIGIASKDIEVGEHVHVHNLDSTRGRGDLSEGSEKI
jgi:altronate dehydratase